MAQCGGPVFAGLGGLCEGGSLCTEAVGTSVGGATALWVASVCGPGGGNILCLGAVLDCAELAEYVTSLRLGPLTVTFKEAALLRGGMITLLGLGMMVLGNPPPLCSSVNRLMASNCSSSTLSGI